MKYRLIDLEWCICPDILDELDDIYFNPNSDDYSDHNVEKYLNGLIDKYCSSVIFINTKKHKNVRNYNNEPIKTNNIKFTVNLDNHSCKQFNFSIGILSLDGRLEKWHLIMTDIVYDILGLDQLESSFEETDYKLKGDISLKRIKEHVEQLPTNAHRVLFALTFIPIPWFKSGK
jgi:hypothetical protein